MDGYRIRDESKPHFVTCTVVGWVDVFSRSIYRDKIIEFTLDEQRILINGEIASKTCITPQRWYNHGRAEIKNGNPSELVLSSPFVKEIK